MNEQDEFEGGRIPGFEVSESTLEEIRRIENRIHEDHLRRDFMDEVVTWMENKVRACELIHHSRVIPPIPDEIRGMFTKEVDEIMKKHGL